MRPHITALLLFGSRARGDHRTHSDYDVLVVVRRNSPALVDALYESVLQVLLTHGRLIRLSGFTTDQIPIVITGIRPGEKLEEALWSAGHDRLCAPGRARHGEHLRADSGNTFGERTSRLRSSVATRTSRR